MFSLGYFYLSSPSSLQIKSVPVLEGEFLGLGFFLSIEQELKICQICSIECQEPYEYFNIQLLSLQNWTLCKDMYAGHVEENK